MKISTKYLAILVVFSVKLNAAAFSTLAFTSSSTPKRASFSQQSLQTSFDSSRTRFYAGAVDISDAIPVGVYTLDGTEETLGEILNRNPKPVVALSCLSHFGDFNAWELTQQYITAIKAEAYAKEEYASIILVGIGSVDSARKFAVDLGIDDCADRITLVADPTGAVTDALGCYKGWLATDPGNKEKYPQADVNPYIKLLGMIFGFGSKGTMGQVLYGYTGDTGNTKGAKGRAWVVDSLLQGSIRGRFPKLNKEAFEGIPADSSLRPFELATLRLQNGLHIVLNWGKLGPKDGDLFTRMGGTFVLSADEYNANGIACKWSHFDQGILSYADTNEVCRVVQALVGKMEKQREI